jgi:hypothetical protein
MQLELENRQLKYDVEQKAEGVRTNEMISSQLRGRLDRLETRLTNEVEGRQVAELKAREFEVTMRSITVSLHQAVEERDGLRAQLQAECEARVLQEGIYQEQVCVCGLSVWGRPGSFRRGGVGGHLPGTGVCVS